MLTALVPDWQVLFTWTVPLSCGGCVSKPFLVLRGPGGSTYIESVLREGALAVGVVRGRCASNLVPASKIRREVETDVWLGIIAAAIPKGWNGVLCCRGGS